MKVTLLQLIFALAVLTLVSCGSSHNRKQVNFHPIKGYAPKGFWDTLPKPSNWVNDYENIYSDAQEQTLNQMLGAFDKHTHIQISIVTIDTSFISKSMFDSLAIHIAHTWGVGEKGKNNGILIGISSGYKKITIRNGTGIEKWFTDSLTKAVVYNNFIPEFRSGHYYQGTVNGLNRLMDLLKEKRPEQQ